MSTKILSIVIPCYNSGKYLLEALSSVELYQGKNAIDVIIVDDGSTDTDTLKLLDELKVNGYTVLHQENKGPAAARNTGVKHSASTYILFLDSDNRIRPEYIDEGIAALEANSKAGVAYGRASFFGEVTRESFDTLEFDINKLIVRNYIDICAVVRKSAWQQVGGLDEDRKIIAAEDWEFWLSIYSAGWRFVFLNNVLFDYRIINGSLLSIQSEESNISKIRYVYNKHALLIQGVCARNNQVLDTYMNDMKRPIRSFFKYLYKSTKS